MKSLNVSVRWVTLLALVLMAVEVHGSQLTNRLFLWTRLSENYASDGKMLTGHAVMVYSHKYVSSQCAMECLRHLQCKSFNFDRDSGRCELNNATHLDHPRDLVDSADSEYHVRESFSIDPEALGPCATDPCNGRGHCIETKNSADDLMAVCICQEEWTGSQCQLPAHTLDWGEWEEWGQCSVTCHRGWRMRKRKCMDHVTGKTLSNLECYGADVEYEACILPECPRWQEWGVWGSCSASSTCGRGNKIRHRACSNGGVPGVDRYCLGSTNQTTPCEGIDCTGAMRLLGGVADGEGQLEIYNDVAGQWGTVCADQLTPIMADLACKQLGHPGAHAVVTDGRYSVSDTGGADIAITDVACEGGEMTLLQCEHNEWSSDSTCKSGIDTAAGVQCNVDGVWTLWTSWSECSVTCENGTRHRTRMCNHPPQMHGGKPCEGDDIQFKPCTLPMCPGGGKWTAWSTWSACSAHCGPGFQSRDRMCLTSSSLPCVGSSMETQECYTPGNCVTVDGVWKDWTEWGPCSVTCGDGTQDRTRVCHGPFYGGANCTGENEQRQHCKPRECPVDGVWEEWGDWSACSLSCGNGTRSRERTCTGPFYDGKDCDGDYVDWEACNTFNCPDLSVDGEWFQWEQWQPCNVTCGVGSQIRERKCNSPRFGGRTCSGISKEWRGCSHASCAIDGVWLEWSEWGACSVTCGNGIQFRNRTCEGPFYGGDDCVGDPEDSQTCHPRMCPVDGLWMDWEAWSQCSTSCGGGSRERTRECYDGQHGGRQCEGEGSETSECETQHCPVDGVWKPWAEWNVCSKTCGTGTRARIRDCEGPFYDGANCTGPWDESENCNTHNCPAAESWVSPRNAHVTMTSQNGRGHVPSNNSTTHVRGAALTIFRHAYIWEVKAGTREMDGVIKEWSEWTECTLTCAGGQRSRHRECNGPFHGGAMCPEHLNETDSCNTQPCPVDGVFLAWSEWGTCSVTCGGGIRMRERTCDGPYHGGANCTGDWEEEDPCNVHHCPEDGVWEDWSKWSECTLTCGGGNQWRARDCIGPFYGGAECPGPANETRDCNAHHCPEDGLWTPWTTWDACSVTCGGGDQQRERNCIGVQHGGKNCTGDSSENRTCNTHECPVDGVFGDWSEWSECILTCSGGSQWRNRTCFGPFYGGSDCLGLSNETQLCNSQPCTVDGYYQDWSSWGLCTVTCGGGSQDRNRTCIEPMYGGQECPGPANETQACNTHNCPVDGYYHDWSDWKDCSVTCGGGSQLRSRICESPKYGGADCVGANNETQECNIHPCPIDGAWTKWSDWSPCNVTCGGGRRARTRECVEPKYGGLPCYGDTIQRLPCADNPCPIPGDWLEWEPWSECTATCDGGKRERWRDCDYTSHGDLTAPCEGDDTENVDCHTFACEPRARTCHEWMERGLTASTLADIDPDGDEKLEEVEIQCDLDSEPGNAITVIGHDSEQRTQVQGWEGAREYEQPITYNISLDHVVSIIDQSTSCKQYIKWECKAALIHNPNDNNKVTTGWLNRTEQLADYFGGAAPGTGACACGMNSTCASEDLLCNCDQNDNIWRFDDGDLTFKQDLPVTAFVAGDTGDMNEEEGFHTLGRVYCWGGAK